MVVDLWNAGSAGLPDEASGISNDGRSRGAPTTPTAPTAPTAPTTPTTPTAPTTPTTPTAPRAPTTPTTPTAPRASRASRAPGRVAEGPYELSPGFWVGVLPLVG